MQAEVTTGEYVVLTVKEAAALMRVCPATVYGWCASGALRHLRLSTHTIRILGADLARFAAARSF